MVAALSASRRSGSKRCGCMAARPLVGMGWPLRYLPPSQPPARGLQGITPMPYCWQTGRTSRSMPRTKIEYGGCSQRKRSRPRRSATHCASTTSCAGKVDDREFEARDDGGAKEGEGFVRVRFTCDAHEGERFEKVSDEVSDSAEGQFAREARRAPRDTRR